MDVRGQGAPQNLSEAQITGFKGLFALGGNAFSTSSAMHPLVKYTITNRTTPQVGDRAIQADGSNRLTLSKRQSPQAAPEKDPFILLHRCASGKGAVTWRCSFQAQGWSWSERTAPDEVEPN